MKDKHDTYTQDMFVRCIPPLTQKQIMTCVNAAAYSMRHHSLRFGQAFINAVYDAYSLSIVWPELWHETDDLKAWQMVNKQWFAFEDREEQL